MTQTADDMRRLAGKFVLLFAGCWLLVLFGGVLSVTRGESIPGLNWMFVLLPGAAFVPATYFAVKLHLTKDPALLREWWPKTLVYGGAGLVLLLGGAYALVQAGGGTGS